MKKSNAKKSKKNSIFAKCAQFFKRVIFGALLILLLVALLWFFALNPKRGQAKSLEETRSLDAVLTSAQAVQDVDFFYKTLSTRHPAWKDGSKEKTLAIDALYKDAKKRFSDITAQKNGVAVVELWRVCATMTALLQDAHTKIVARENDALYAQKNLLPANCSISAINGVAVDEIYERYKNYFACELEDAFKTNFYENAIFRKSYLHLCGLDTQNGVTFNFDNASTSANSSTSKNAQSQNLNAQNSLHVGFVPLSTINNLQNASNAQSEQSLQNVQNVQNVQELNFWSIDSESAKVPVGVLTLKTCRYDKSYKKMLANFFSAVHAQNVKHIIVDLRGNGGGNSLVANEFLRYLGVEQFADFGCKVRIGPVLLGKKQNTTKLKPHTPAFTGTVSVLTDSDTFSSAMMFATYIQDNALGTIIGETSCNKCNSYGDVIIFALPNSNLLMLVSYKKWFRPVATNGDFVVPDILCNAKDALNVAFLQIDNGI